MGGGKYISNNTFEPKGIIDNNILWSFPHAVCVKNAVEKWNEKRKEIHYENIAALMIIQSDKDAEEFNELPIKRKLGIYYKNLNLKSVLFAPEWKEEEVRSKYGFGWSNYVHRYITNAESVSRIDWIKFLNGNEDFLRY